jgi:hypothetical protein
MERFWTVACALLLIAGLSGCSDTEHRKPCTTCPPPPPPSEKWHALQNLELAYNDMNIVEYRKIFDAENFIFFFDVGGSVPVQWGYAEETQSAANMFSHAGGIENNPILAIDLALFDIETATWVEITDPEGFPGETWYETVLEYDFDIETASGTHYITAGNPTCAFTVREIDGVWKLVRWRDRAVPGAASAAPASVEETTWGKLKALY